MKKSSFLLSIFILLWVSISIYGQELDILDRYVEAHNAHNPTRELSFLHPEIVFEIKNTWIKKGIYEMRHLAEWDSVFNSTLSVELLRQSEDSLICKIKENNDWFAAMGVQDIAHEPTIFKIRGNKIISIIAVPSERAIAQINQAITKVVHWSLQNHDSTIFSLTPNGQFVYSKDAAQARKQLFKRWNGGCDTIYFTSDGEKVHGYFYSSNVKESPSVIFSQGFMESGDLWGIGKTLSTNGINVMMFDFRGCFKSEGKQGLVNSQRDLDAALSFIKSEYMTNRYGIDTSSIILVGYSYGGHMSMLYAAYHPEVKRVVSISGGDLGVVASQFVSDTVMRKNLISFFSSLRKPNGPVDFLYQDPTEELVQNREYFSIIQNAEKLADRDILVIGGADDMTVSIENHILPLYRALRNNHVQKVKLLVYQTGHSYHGVSQNLLTDLITWIRQ